MKNKSNASDLKNAVKYSIDATFYDIHKNVPEVLNGSFYRVINSLDRPFEAAVLALEIAASTLHINHG